PRDPESKPVKNSDANTALTDKTKPLNHDVNQANKPAASQDKHLPLGKNFGSDDFMTLMFSQLGIDDSALDSLNVNQLAGADASLDGELSLAVEELDALLQGSAVPEAELSLEQLLALTLGHEPPTDIDAKVLNELAALLAQWQQGNDKEALPPELQNLLTNAWEQLQQGQALELSSNELAQFKEWLSTQGLEAKALDKLDAHSLAAMLQQTLAASGEPLPNTEPKWQTAKDALAATVVSGKDINSLVLSDGANHPKTALNDNAISQKGYQAELSASATAQLHANSHSALNQSPQSRSNILGEGLVNSAPNAGVNLEAQSPLNSQGSMASQLSKSLLTPQDAPLSEKQMASLLADAKFQVVENETKTINVLPSTASASLDATKTQNVSQVQLSLRQHLDQQLQQHEMIERFAPVMRSQLLAMVSQGIGQAEIRLDPPELGSLLVRIQVQGDQTQVQFVAASAQTRDMLEQAMPKLRDLLNDQGMQLADSQVSEQGKEQQQQGKQEGGIEGQTDMLTELSSAELETSSNQTTSYAQGIDYYA
ncbi:MAG: flagellar hook-length control protein FliK, partial [Shewanella sp.]